MPQSPLMDDLIQGATALAGADGADRRRRTRAMVPKRAGRPHRRPQLPSARSAPSLVHRDPHRPGGQRVDIPMFETMGGLRHGRPHGRADLRATARTRAATPATSRARPQAVQDVRTAISVSSSTMTSSGNSFLKRTGRDDPARRCEVRDLRRPRPPTSMSSMPSSRVSSRRAARRSGSSC